jgi:hypothetical protein
LYHRTRTFPLPVGDQRRFLLCRNTTFSKDNVAAATLISIAEHHMAA